MTPPADPDDAAELARFFQDPVAAMNRQPSKQIVQGREGPLPFAGYTAGGAFVEDRDRVRRKTCGKRDGQIIRLDQVLPGRAPFLRNDLAEDLVDVVPAQVLRTLEAMEARGLLGARLPHAPWSSTYWPVYQGQIAMRYADPRFPASQDWKQNRGYVEQNPAAAIVRGGDPAALANLSPAEKYDLLIGDPDLGLTTANWDAGRGYYESQGSVETWMGICHGWSPAAYMLPRPLRPLSLLAADGTTRLTFYPADIKALGCLLWASTSPLTRFIGGRCNDKTPATDPQSGRTLSASCFDTNPGTWHMAVVNQIGLAQRSFVMDASFDYEVWNQPVLQYRYGYFNPQSGQPVDSIAAARVERQGFNDRFARYRSANARSLVGIVMNLVYVAETLPDHTESDSESRDRLVTVRYLYDLELDESGQILGGEWYLNKHPDFLWTPPPDGQALSTQDGNVEGVWGDGAIPDGWRDAAIAASAAGQPLASIVNTLFQMAR